MTAVLLGARIVVSALICVLVGLAFLPHAAAARLTDLQILLTEKIERRRAARTNRVKGASDDG